jgi:hypothetical protein
MTQAAKLAALGTSTGTSVLVSGTAVATTSGTTATITGIPSWAKRVTFTLNGVVNADNNYMAVQLGSGTLQTTGYSGSMSVNTSTVVNAIANIATYFYIANQVTGTTMNGTLTFVNVGSNTWILSGLAATTSGRINMSSGIVTLSGALDRISLFCTTSGAFSAGSINILYE